MNEKTHGAPDEGDASILQVLRTAGVRPVPGADARERARTAAHDAWRQTVAARTRRRRIAVAAPLLAAAAVILAFVLPSTRLRSPLPELEIARVARGAVFVASAAGGPREVSAGNVLASGSVVTTGEESVAALAIAGGGELRLNGGSAVRLTGRRQFVLEDGHLYLDSGGGADAAVEVKTAVGVVRNMGTRFDIRLRDGELRVRVRDGAVRLDTGVRQADAGAGQQLLVRAGGAPEVTPAVTYGRDWEWLLHAAPFEAEGARLEDFLRWVETEGGWRIEFSDRDLRQALAGTRLHGSIDGLTLDETLEVVLAACGLRHRLRHDRVVIDRDGGRR